MHLDFHHPSVRAIASSSVLDTHAHDHAHRACAASGIARRATPQRRRAGSSFRARGSQVRPAMSHPQSFAVGKFIRVNMSPALSVSPAFAWPVPSARRSLLSRSTNPTFVAWRFSHLLVESCPPVLSGSFYLVDLVCYRSHQDVGCSHSLCRASASSCTGYGTHATGPGTQYPLGP